MFLTCISIPFFTLLLPGLTVADSPIVSLSYGKYQGFVEGNLAQFLGVPFAHAERFRLPTEPIPFPGIQNASEYGPACPQQALGPLPGLNISGLTAPISEECLTLDVFKPKLVTSARLPVLVWLYGGGFSVGNTRADDLKPLVERSITTQSPLIAVTVNYRVNAFGFLGGKEAAAAGITNIGLRDQIFALRWVQKHIANFGGDPSRVVLGGLSAGSISSSFLSLNNRYMSNTLFRGIFLQSGVAFHIRPQSDGQSEYDALVQAADCTKSKSTLDCLRHAPFDTLMAAVNNTPSITSYQTLNQVWAPHIDGDVIETDAWTAVRKGLYGKMPVLVTACDDEGTMFSLPTLNITSVALHLFSHRFLSDDRFVGRPTNLWITFLYTATPVEIAQVSRLWPDDPTQGSPFDTGTENQLGPQYKRIAAFIGDDFEVSPRRFFLQHASARQNVWGTLNKRGKIMNVPLGAFHTSDGPIWFTNSTALGNFGMDALVSFVNRLDPNAPTNHSSSALFWPKWNTPSTEGDSSLLTFTDSDVQIIPDNFRKEAIDFLNEVRVRAG
ncbi:carboxylic ester hydrolase [Favolaschia claudopus]|uniref:Carboxylic ester hydrolase n=1 Tax=Favolaschia claudopus TaxID=2862362 RepID=A0AAW0EDX3_9AGAR